MQTFHSEHVQERPKVSACSVWIHFGDPYNLVYVCIYMYMYVCVIDTHAHIGMCTHAHTHTHTHTHNHLQWTITNNFVEIFLMNLCDQLIIDTYNY